MTVSAPTFDGTQACAGADVDLFFPGESGYAKYAIRQAKALCAGCRFVQQCLEYALTTRVVGGPWMAGVWGGTTEHERREIRRVLRSAA